MIAALDRPAGARGERKCVLRLQRAVMMLGGRKVLDGASLELREGELFALLGPNGAGKTSLVRALCGHAILSNGRVEVGDSVLNPRAHPHACQAIGLVPQDVALFRSLTVRENLDVFVQLAGRPKDRVHTDAVLRASRLTEVANTLVAHLSGGLQRRANIAVALSLGAKALLLDEPTTGIDVEARAPIHELLRELRDAGTAILLVTHDFEQAERLADRVGFMIHGRIVREGRPTEILQQAFGRKIQVEAILMEPPERAGAAILEALGLSPFEGRRIWRGLADPGPSLPEAFEQLRAGPVSIHEVRVRSPGLDMLFHQLIADASRSNGTRVPSAEEIATGDVP